MTGVFQECKTPVYATSLTPRRLAPLCTSYLGRSTADLPLARGLRSATVYRLLPSVGGGPRRSGVTIDVVMLN